MFTKKKFIVIALTEHLGDIVAAEPVARYLKNKFPGCFLAWVVDKKYKELISSNPTIDKAISVSCFTEWILLKHFLSKKNVYDLHINNKICARHHFINIKSNPFKIELENYFVKGNLLYAFSRSAGIEMKADIAPLIYLKPKSAISLTEKYIVMHTTGSHPHKALQGKCWNELANFILDKFSKYSIAEIGFEKKINITHERMIDMTGEKPLPVISDLIDKSRLFIGIDSSFAHFANALEKDSLILIGSWGNFIQYMPYSGKFQKEKNDIIFYYPRSLQEMPCHDIFDLVSKKLNP